MTGGRRKARCERRLTALVPITSNPSPERGEGWAIEVYLGR